MQRKRNIYLLIVLVFLILVSSSLYIFDGSEVKVDIDRNLFKPAESEKIDQVTIQSPSQNIELKFDNNHWKVNNTWEADSRMIKVLFATLTQAEPKRPVAATLRDSIKLLLEKTGTRISLSEGGQKIQEFITGGNAAKTETWFLKEGDSQPYIMTIPGYRVYVGGILELDENGWRNKRVFDFYWQNFKSLTSTYPKDPKQGFEIERKSRYFGIKDVANADTTKVNDYLDAVSLLFASKFLSSGQKRVDSLMTTVPAVKIEVRDIANRSFTLELFTPGKQDNEVYGRMADGQILTLEKSKVAEIVRRKDYFLINKGN
ncbi:MAG: DUF4340 domain-containing protein [Cyclobacteriaceae bacterium]|nr:DUF4340 domain-containing protein [Cyclobacteriaceae bacterium]